MKLIAKRPVYMDGAWIQPGQPVPYGVAGFDYERADRKGSLEAVDGDEITNPESAEVAADVQDGTQLDEILQANQSLKADLDKQRQATQRLTKERGDLKAQVTALQAGGATASPLADRDAAIAKISSVNRVSDAMAGEIYDALTISGQ